MIRIPREMEIYRRHLNGARGDNHNGYFVIPNRNMVIIAGHGGGWDHVSVSIRDRCPTWDEMEWVRRKLFEDTDTVIQIHPPLSEYVNCHPYVLHMWRPWDTEIPLPPRAFI